MTGAKGRPPKSYRISRYLGIPGGVLLRSEVFIGAEAASASVNITVSYFYLLRHAAKGGLISLTRLETIHEGRPKQKVFIEIVGL